MAQTLYLFFLLTFFCATANDTTPSKANFIKSIGKEWKDIMIRKKPCLRRCTIHKNDADDLIKLSRNLIQWLLLFAIDMMRGGCLCPNDVDCYPINDLKRCDQHCRGMQYPGSYIKCDGGKRCEPCQCNTESPENSSTFYDERMKSCCHAPNTLVTLWFALTVIVAAIVIYKTRLGSTAVKWSIVKVKQ